MGSLIIALLLFSTVFVGFFTLLYVFIQNSEGLKPADPDNPFDSTSTAGQTPTNKAFSGNFTNSTSPR